MVCMWFAFSFSSPERLTGQKAAISVTMKDSGIVRRYLDYQEHPILHAFSPRHHLSRDDDAWASKTAQQVKAFAAEPDNLSLVPGTYTVEVENQLLKAVNICSLNTNMNGL